MKQSSVNKLMPVQEPISTSSYIELVTGYYYCADLDDDETRINRILPQTTSYAFTDLESVVADGKRVVLVDMLMFEGPLDEPYHEYRWFVIPDDITDDMIKERLG